ncbi:MAG TPA: 5-formyltetrahydrofolate cyclo-ligase [Actinomycetota bacterium]
MSGVPAHRLRRAKRALRREMLARRDALSERERARASEAIADRVASLPEVRVARSVMAFWSFGSEVDTRPLLARIHGAGKAVCLPRIHEGEVVPVEHRPGDPVTPTSFGAMEPAGGRVVRPEELDVVVTPGVAFDRRGHRVGYGGGYYDRLLARVGPEAATVGIAFAIQVVDEVPAGGSDRRVDAVVTEREVIRCPTG